MEIILKRDVPSVGSAGDIVRVSDGYARNYLIPRQLAGEATPAALKAREVEKAVRERKLKKQREEALAMKERLGSLTLTIPRRVGEQDKLFGAVTSEDIAEGLGAQGFPVDKKKVVLEEPIKSLGVFQVPIRLFPDVDVAITIRITQEG